jgi:hypothetical protein
MSQNQSQQLSSVSRLATCYGATQAHAAHMFSPTSTSTTPHAGNLSPQRAGAAGGWWVVGRLLAAASRLVLLLRRYRHTPHATRHTLGFDGFLLVGLSSASGFVLRGVFHIRAEDALHASPPQGAAAAAAAAAGGGRQVQLGCLHQQFPGPYSTISLIQKTSTNIT